MPKISRTIILGVVASAEASTDPIMIISDSLLPPVAAADEVDTLQICSPSQLLNTDVAKETLKDLDIHDKSVEVQAQDCSKTLFPCMQLLLC